jgi:hypothetical protein
MVQSRMMVSSRALLAALLLSACSGAGPTAAAAPAVNACLQLRSASDLTQEATVDCGSPHEGQVYAVVGLPAGLTDPADHNQVKQVTSSVTCPTLRSWVGYTGSVPLGVFGTWRFPTREQIAAGAHWTACVAVVAPGADHKTLTRTVGTLSGRLTGATNPLPAWGRCSEKHTNSAFTPVVCVRGSSQWVWLGEHKKPPGAYPGKAKAKKVADEGCRVLVSKYGRGGGWVYYPTSATGWAKSAADWSCWLQVAQLRS